MKVTELEPGHELQCWMKLGLALTQRRRKDGRIYYVVPANVQRRRGRDLTRFVATVAVNDTGQGLLTLRINRADLRMTATADESYMACAHYTSFSRIRVLSPTHFEPREENWTFPANFEDAAFKPYRTATEVKLRWP